MDDLAIARQRLWNLLEGTRCGSPPEVLRRLTAVQGQEFLPALWSVSQRLTTEPAEAELLGAFDEGAFLRTHVLRPTWHLVSPDDLGLLVAATGERVQAILASRYRQLELDPRTRGRCRDELAAMLRGGTHLTRNQVGERLAARGIELSGSRLAHALMDAELEGLICSGARQGRHHTYALADERVADAPRLARDEAILELTRRYLAAHGPATDRDLHAWSSLRLTDVRPALQELLAAGAAVADEHDGRTYWDLADRPVPPATDPPPVLLLQAYDEYVMGYRDSRHVIDVAGRADNLHPDAVIPNHIVLVDGQLAGNWGRTVTSEDVAITAYLYDVPDDRREEQLHAAADRYGRFLQLPVRLAIRDHLDAPVRFRTAAGRA